MLKRKKLIAGLLVIVLNALMIAPAYADVGYTNGTIDGYLCRGSINTTSSQATATTSISGANAYLYARVEILQIDAFGNGTWSYAANSKLDGSGISVTKTKSLQSTLVCGKGIFSFTLGGGTWTSTKTSEP